MINKISNIAELKKEKARLRQHKIYLEEAMKQDVNDIKESLNPANIFKKKVQEYKTGNGSIMNKVIGLGLGSGLEFLLLRVFMKRSSFITKAIITVLMQYYGRNLVSKNSDTIISMLKRVFSKLKDFKHDNEVFDSSTASADFKN
jgi:predicted alternative tryptophan synthase beta-subunit